jgi:catechol 2,3-dioxygenase-like lactoylglutathione lyase family enzyme
MQIAYVNIFVSDLARSIEFYQGKLGLDLSSRRLSMVMPLYRRARSASGSPFRERTMQSSSADIRELAWRSPISARSIPD